MDNTTNDDQQTKPLIVANMKDLEKAIERDKDTYIPSNGSGKHIYKRHFVLEIIRGFLTQYGIYLDSSYKLPAYYSTNGNEEPKIIISFLDGIKSLSPCVVLFRGKVDGNMYKLYSTTKDGIIIEPCDYNEFMRSISNYKQNIDGLIQEFRLQGTNCENYMRMYSEKIFTRSFYYYKVDCVFESWD